MAAINKVQFPLDSGFDLETAMELANLITVSQDDYEVLDQQDSKNRQLPPPEITSSKAFIKLPLHQLEEVDPKEINKLPRTYGRLNRFWQQAGKVELYKRLYNFWFPEWWWGEVFKFKNVQKLFNTNIEDVRTHLKDLVISDQLFGFIAQSKIQEHKYFVVFRGTREAAEWINNFRPTTQSFLEAQFEHLGDVRNGFNLIYSEKREKDFFSLNNEKRNPTIQETISQFFD